MSDNLAVEIFERMLVGNREVLSTSLALKALPFGEETSWQDSLWTLRQCLVSMVITYNFDPEIHDELTVRARHCAMNDPRSIAATNIARTQSQMCLSYLLSTERSADFVVSQLLTFKKGLATRSEASDERAGWRRTILSLDTVFSDEMQAAAENQVEFEEEFWAATIWPVSGGNSFLVSQIEKFLSYLKESDPSGFWYRWYSAMWDGTFRDWDLAIEVAKLPDDLWEGDDAPQKVAEAIREIELKHTLLNEIADLRKRMEEMRRSVQAPAQGHNQGPPLDDTAAAQIPRQFELVWPILDSLEEEANKKTPDPTRLQSLALALWEIAQKIVAYCGGVLDVGLKKAAETLGEQGTKWTIRVLAAEAVASNSGVQSVAKAAWKFAQALGGGG